MYGKEGWLWWHAPTIPAVWETEVEDFEFEVSVGNTERPHFKRKKRINRGETQ